MRGTDERSGSLFSYVDLEARIPARAIPLAHDPRASSQPAPVEALRKSLLVEANVRAAWAALDPHLRSCCAPRCYKPSIRSSSERQLMERLEFDTADSAGSSGLASDDGIWVDPLRVCSETPNRVCSKARSSGQVHGGRP